MKKNLTTALAALLVLSMLLSALIGCRNTFGDQDSSDPKDPNAPEQPIPPKSPISPIVQLPAPDNVAFDSTSYILSWTAIENASAYVIWYNGSEITVDAKDAEEQITLTATENLFKVMAIGDDSYYSDSEWSETISYTIDSQQQELSVFEKVNLKIAQAAQEKGIELVSVLGISYINLEGNNYGDNIAFQILGKKRDVVYNYELVLHNPGFSSVSDLLNNIDKATTVRCPDKEIVNYNSVQCLLDSMGNFGEKMQELANQGYEIIPINTCVLEGQNLGATKFRFHIIGTFMATRDGDTKYFSTKMRIDILNKSSNAMRNYESSVEFQDYRTVTEIELIMHNEAGTLEYIAEWAAKNSTPPA